jgi:transposase
MVFVGDKGFDSDELRQLIEDNGGLACIPPRSNRTSHRWCDPEFYRKRHLVEISFSASSIGAAWRPVTRNSPQPFSLSQHSLPQSITSDVNKSTRPSASSRDKALNTQDVTDRLPIHPVDVVHELNELAPL